jgi:DNA polymerase III sliding clamp (beta) subunit (PCNA family)
MKTTQELKQQVARLKSLIGRNPNLPILENILFMDGKMLGTNLGTTLIYDSEEKGTFLIAAVKLSEILKNVKANSDLGFKYNTETHILHVSINGVDRFQLEHDDPSEFPRTPEVTEFKSGLTPDILQAMVKATNFTEDDDLIPTLKGICFTNNHVVATDGHRLYFKKVDLKTTAKEQITLNLRNAAIKSEINEAKLATLYVDPANFSIVTNKCQIVGRRIDGKYPNFKAVLPNRKKGILLTIPKSEFEANIKLALNAANESTHQVILSPKGNGTLGIDAGDEKTHFTTVMDCKFETTRLITKEELQDSERELRELEMAMKKALKENADEETLTKIKANIEAEEADIEKWNRYFEEFQIGFNAKFLLHYLKLCNKDTVKLRIYAPNKATVFNNECLIMPQAMADQWGKVKK